MNAATHRVEGSANAPVLYRALELSSKSWKVVLGDGVRRRQVAVPAGELSQVRNAVAEAKERFGLGGSCRVLSGYEAGRDGFWLHRHLRAVGKTFLACALAHKACREGYSAFYARLPRLLQDLELGRGDGRYAKLMKSLARIEVLVLDDLGIAPLTEHGRRDLLELMDDRHNVRSTIVTSQLPVAHWHEAIGEPTLADAILDRLVHNAHKIALHGNSMRKTKEKLTAAKAAE